MSVRLNKAGSVYMRLGYSALMSLLLVSAVPSVSLAQVVVPCSPLDEAITEAVPVATVTRLDDAIGLAHARKLDTFVLGAASLDMRDPRCTRVAFTMTNVADAPVLLTNVSLHGVRMNLSDSPAQGLPLKSICSTDVASIDHRMVKDTTLQPGATITVEMPVARGCPALGRTVGFLVSIRSDGTHWWGPGEAPVQEQTEEAARLRKAFQALIALSPQ